MCFWKNPVLRKIEEDVGPHMSEVGDYLKLGLEGNWTLTGKAVLGKLWCIASCFMVALSIASDADFGGS